VLIFLHDVVVAPSLLVETNYQKRTGLGRKTKSTSAMKNKEFSLGAAME
jgi:hypothetical protein